MKTAVLLIVFKRPDPTASVFEAISRAKPSRLYIACDGPRSGNADEVAAVRKVQLVVSRVDWDCEVKTLYQRENLGCRKAVATAIDWFFEHENEGIILEDDCLPGPDFFVFCELALCRYRDDHRVWSVTGNNFQSGTRRGAASYYFSRYPHIWGWATWKRCWKHYDPDMAFWPDWRSSKDWRTKITDNGERKFWAGVFDKTHRGEIDTWDFQWVAALWRAGGLTVTPQQNLVTNIGFGHDATHTKTIKPHLVIPTGHFTEIDEPSPEVEADPEADRYVFATVFSRRTAKGPRCSLVGRKAAEIIRPLAAVAARLFTRKTILQEKVGPDEEKCRQG